jgi:hypothetical protein
MLPDREVSLPGRGRSGGRAVRRGIVSGWGFPPKGGCGPVSRKGRFHGFSSCQVDESRPREARSRGRYSGKAGELSGIEELSGSGRDCAHECEDSSAVGAEEGGALRRGGLRGKGEPGGLGDETAGLLQRHGAVGAQETEVAHFHEARGQDVLEVAAQELEGRDGGVTCCSASRG